MPPFPQRPTMPDSHCIGRGCIGCACGPGDSPASGEVWFGAFPKRDRALRPDSAFGTHVTAVVGEPTNALAVSEAMGARWVRFARFRRLLPLAHRRAAAGTVRVARRRSQCLAGARVHDPGQPRPSTRLGWTTASQGAGSWRLDQRTAHAASVNGNATSSARSEHYRDSHPALGSLERAVLARLLRRHAGAVR